MNNPADGKLSAFSFDAVFQDASQADIYNEIARPLVENVLVGYNATIFAYGQTGTGKTFTMEGEPSPEKKGIIPNSFAQIFTSISKAPPDTRYGNLQIIQCKFRSSRSNWNWVRQKLENWCSISVFIADS